MENETFTLLENKAIGKNISMYRKIRGIKASEVAEKLGIKESSYSRYECGETALTIDIIRQVAEILHVDPLMILSVPAGAIIESGNNSPGAILGRVHGSYNYQTTNEQQVQLMLKLIENVTVISEKIIALLDKTNK